MIVVYLALAFINLTNSLMLVTSTSSNFNWLKAVLSIACVFMGTLMLWEAIKSMVEYFKEEK